MKPFTAWIVLDGNGRPDPETLRPTEQWSKLAFLKNRNGPWEDYTPSGCKVVRVLLSEYPEEPPRVGLMEALARLREAGGDGWDKVDDPERVIREARGEE